ncbi:MAG: hypothetical protein V4629_10255 [Pseudomonadota bacterium]
MKKILLKTILLVNSAFTLTSCIIIEEGPRPEYISSDKSFSISLEKAPPIAAQYRTSACDLPCKNTKENDWYFWRDSDQIEIRNSQNTRSELWIKDSQTEKVTYFHLLPEDLKGIEYNPVDLKLLGNDKKWESLATLISPESISTMMVVGETKFLGFDALIFQSEKNQVKNEVIWIPELQLAAKVSQIDGNHQVVSELSTLLKNNYEKPTTSEDFIKYQIIDFSDVGDMEHSLANNWVKKAVHAPGHEHH